MFQTAADLSAACSSALEEARAARRRFLDLSPEAGVSAAVAAFDAIGVPLNRVTGWVSLLSNVHSSEDLRRTAREQEQVLAAFATELGLDRELYEGLAALDPEQAASPEERRLIEHGLRDFRRSGVDRDEPTRERIRALREQLVELGQRFDKNIVDDVRSIRIADGRAGLAGLPEDYVAAHPEDASGAVTITTDGPDYVPFATYSRRDDLREQLYREYVTRATPVNLELLGEILARRHELAGLLGFEDWAGYATEDKMARTTQAVREFLERVVELATPRMQAEYDELLEELRREDPAAEVVRDWQRIHVTERVKARKHGFDSQTVRPYFAYDRVRDGVLATSAALFGVEFRSVSAETWHPDVESYDVVDGGEVVARFHLDMHPRAGKYKHAAMFDGCAGVLGECIPQATLVCNLPRPEGDDPGLLLHDQVTTFFHEFGHLLHHLFAGRQRFLAFSGIATEWDFVEVPSQMYEEWAWETGVLQRFARHYETDEPIPAELVQRMRAAEEYGKGLHVCNQMFYALLALAYHAGDPRELDLLGTLRELKERVTRFPFEPGTCFPASFGHLNGYSALYYTYMWSHVISKDLFGRFKGDPMDREVANAYRRSVLAPGGARDAAELVRGFLGRDYEFAAWQRWLER